MSNISEPYNVHHELVALWIRQAVYFEGDFMVKNAGRSYLSVVKGKAVFRDNGLLTNYKRKPEVLEKILHGLVDRYLNFTHRGYYYFYSRGEWQRFQVE